MARKLTYWLAAASVLLMVGAGCTTEVQPSASVQTGAETGMQAPPQEAPTTAKVEAKSDVDIAVDSALKQVDDETAASMQENADANVVSNDSAELNAYGQAYDQSQL